MSIAALAGSNAGQLSNTGIFPGAERAGPLLGGFAKFVERKASMILGKARKLHDSRSQQRFRAGPIAALIMVEGGRDLDEALQECFFRLGGSEPNFFPIFMGFEEFPQIEIFETPNKLFVMLAGFHRGCCRLLIKLHQEAADHNSGRTGGRGWNSRLICRA